jgi:hypothetical protein
MSYAEPLEETEKNFNHALHRYPSNQPEQAPY